MRPYSAIALDTDRVKYNVPQASIILVNYNNQEDLIRCLPGLFLTKDVTYQVILVDNASTDGSPAVLEAAFPGLEVVRAQSNLGFAEGCNLGAKYAQGEYLVFLNPDTVVKPDWLAPLVACLEQQPKAGMVTSKILLLEQPGLINTAGNNIHISGITLCRGARQPEENLTEPTEVSAVSGAAFAIRHSLFDFLGGFDSDYFMYMEDTDLSWRARLAGYNCLYEPKSLVYHDYTLKFRGHKTFYQERNRYITLLKNLNWRSLAALIPVLILAEVVTWGFVITQQRVQWKDKLLAYRWIVDNWPLIRQKRRQTQGLRKQTDRTLLQLHTPVLDFEQTTQARQAALARRLFNPLFAILRSSVLTLIRW
jgi:hypothetical protein